MDLNELVESYDFNQSVLWYRESDDFKKLCCLEDYEKKFAAITELFWSESDLKIDEMKREFEIPENFNFRQIVRAYPNDNGFHLEVQNMKITPKNT